MAEKGEPRDFWDKADVASKWLIPVAVAVATLGFNMLTSARQAKEKNLEVAISILQVPSGPQSTALRKWALSVFASQTGIQEAAIEELKQGESLPTSLPIQQPVNAPSLKVSIIRLQGSPTTDADRITQALSSGTYSRITSREAPANAFPDQSEVRFYFPEDKQSAQALSETINQSLNVQTRLRDRSQDADVSNHRRGDLNVYLR